MSMQAINYAMTLPVDEPGPRLLLILIAHHINWKSGDMFVGQEELAQEARMTSRTVRNHLVILEERGFIERAPQRDDSGRRGMDRISLVGYLEWQDVLYNGGTIRPPSQLGKPVETQPETQPENSSCGCGSNRKNSADQPEKSGQPTGSCFPVYKNPSLTISNKHSAPLPPEPADPPGSGQVNVNCSREVRPAIRIRSRDASWGAWLDHIETIAGHGARREAAELGEIRAVTRWPAVDTPLPTLAARPRP